MAWLESHQDLGRHPKTKRLARTLAISVPTAIGHLHLLWWWALDFADDGDLTAYSADEIADAALWEGDPETFLAALVHTRFVDDGDNARVIHDWDEYSGKLIDARRTNAERQKRWRERHRHDSNIKEDDNDLDNCDVTPTLPLRNPATVPNSTGPNPTEPGSDVLSTDVDKTPPDGGRTLTVYEKYAGRLKEPKANRPAILEDALAELYGCAADPKKIGHIGALAKQAGGADQFLRWLMDGVKNWPGVDDPHDWIAGIVKKRLQHKNDLPAPPASQYDGPRFNGGYAETDVLKAERQEIDRRGDLAALTGILSGKVLTMADEKVARATREEIRAKIGGGGNGKAPRPTYRIKDVGPTADRASPEHRPGDHEAPERTGQSS